MWPQRSGVSTFNLRREPNALDRQQRRSRRYQCWSSFRGTEDDPGERTPMWVMKTRKGAHLSFRTAGQNIKFVFNSFENTKRGPQDSEQPAITGLGHLQLHPVQHVTWHSHLSWTTRVPTRSIGFVCFVCSALLSTSYHHLLISASGVASTLTLPIFLFPPDSLP